MNVTVLTIPIRDKKSKNSLTAHVIMSLFPVPVIKPKT